MSSAEVSDSRRGDGVHRGCGVSRRRKLDRVVDLLVSSARLVRRWLAGQVLLKIVSLLMRWLFSLAVLVSSGDPARNAELLVLRHENAVLRRNAGRVRYEPADRVPPGTRSRC